VSDYDHDQLHRAFQLVGPVAICTWAEGYREGIRRGAVQGRGGLIVGVLEEPLKEVFKHIEAITADLVAAAATEGIPPGRVARAFADLCVSVAEPPDGSGEIPSDPAGSRWVRTQDLVVGDHVRCYGDEWRVMGFCSNGDAEVRLVGSAPDSKRCTITKGNELLLLGSEVSLEARAEILDNDGKP